MSWLDGIMYMQNESKRYVMWKWIVERGRAWVEVEWGSNREDGWWLLGYYTWAPKIWLLGIAMQYALITGDNNLFYTMKRRRELRLSDEEIFRGPEIRG